MYSRWLAVAFLALSTIGHTQTRSVALTFDDLPAVNTTDAAEVRSINLALLKELDRRHAPATAFVIGNIADLTPESRPMLQEWKRRGYSISNHTWSHNNFVDITVAQEQYDILHGERAIAQLLPSGTKFLRFPYNSTGETPEKHAAILAFLKTHQYQIATCTIDNEDYVFAEAYDKIYTQLHKQLFGREIPHVMLLHANRLNADTIKEVLDLFASRNYRFVSLTQAQSDAAYATPDTFATKSGMMWAYRWSHVLGIQFTGPHETEPPDWITQYGLK